MLVYVIGANFANKDVEYLRVLENKVRGCGHTVYSSKAYSTLKNSDIAERNSISKMLIRCNRNQLEKCDLVLVIARCDGISGIEVGLALSNGKKVIVVQPSREKTIQTTYLEKMGCTVIRLEKLIPYLKFLESNRHETV